MRGQWIGAYEGSNPGEIIVNVDELSDVFQGIAYVNPTNKVSAMAVAVYFRTENKAKEFRLVDVDVLPIDPYTGTVTRWEQLKLPPDTPKLTKATVQIKWTDATTDSQSAPKTGSKLSLEWTTNVGTSGKAVLDASSAGEPSELVPAKMSWADFKTSVNTLPRDEYLFRGQAERWRLRTAYHRTQRADLNYFLGTHIAEMHRQLSALTRHYFDVDKPSQNGAFLNLLQHHGYPTPILDWTHSPYVAAFFAYRELNPQTAETEPEDSAVRIHVLNRAAWLKLPQHNSLIISTLHFSLWDFVAVNNDRMIPQQSSSSATNVDDIESYIRNLERVTQLPCLSAIDLPKRERPLVMRELAYMGITAGSLFPGLDGACAALRERHFAR